MRRSFAVAAVFLTLALQSGACEKAKLAQTGEEEGKQTQAVQEASMPSGSINVANITVHTQGGKSINVPVEIATTEEQRIHGLMGRSELPFKTGGMWFVFAEDMTDPFWMKDTSIPLDIIFVGPDMKIVDIKANTTPNSEEKLYPPGPYRYVLEVAAGFALTNGLAAGDQAVYGIGPQ